MRSLAPLALNLNLSLYLGDIVDYSILAIKIQVSDEILANVHNRGRIFHFLTWKGMVRLIFSPTFLMYFVLSSRGRRIFGCSKAEGSNLLKYPVILLCTSLSTVDLQRKIRARWIYSLTCV